jgi:hypothetical protein
LSKGENFRRNLEDVHFSKFRRRWQYLNEQKFFVPPKLETLKDNGQNFSLLHLKKVFVFFLWQMIEGKQETLSFAFQTVFLRAAELHLGVKGLKVFNVLY